MKILVPVDGSKNAEQAVAYAIRWAAEMKSVPEIILLNVQWNVASGNAKLFIDTQTVSDYYLEQGLAALAGGRAMVAAANLPYRYHVSMGTPAEAIMEYAEEQAVDLIVMGAQGAGGVARLLLGSTVAKVMQLSKSPTVVVKG